MSGNDGHPCPSSRTSVRAVSGAGIPPPPPRLRPSAYSRNFPYGPFNLEPVGGSPEQQVEAQLFGELIAAMVERAEQLVLDGPALARRAGIALKTWERLRSGETWSNGTTLMALLRALALTPAALNAQDSGFEYLSPQLRQRVSWLDSNFGE